MTDSKIAILGAGPGGLAAAHVLTESGIEVDVLEKNDSVGALCTTYERDGFRFDLGGHRWFTKNEELHRWFLELMDGELVTVRRTSRICLDRELVSYPISAGSVLKNAGVFTSAHARLSYLSWAIRDLVSRSDASNIEEAYCKQFGRQLFETYFRRYTEKVWGRPCSELSPDWVTRRTKGVPILTALRDALIWNKTDDGLIDEFVYPRLGAQRVCERMAEDVEKNGGRIHLGATVQAVTYRGPREWTVEHATAQGKRSFQATDVISSLPLSGLAEVIAPACSREVREAARSLQFRDLITITVMVEREQIMSDTWLYVHDEDILFARLHEPKNLSPDMVPGPQYSSVVCECFCSAGDDIWTMTDEQITERVVADLADELGLIDQEDVIDTCVIRSRDAFPVHDLDYRENVDKLYGFVRDHAGLHVVGCNGTFRCNTADRAVEMGRMLGKRLLGQAAGHNSHEEIRRTFGGKRAAASRRDETSQAG